MSKMWRLSLNLAVLVSMVSFADASPALEALLDGKPLRDDECRLTVELLRVPAQALAVALADDSGVKPGFWSERLLAMREMQRLDLVDHWEINFADHYFPLTDGHEFREREVHAGSELKHRYIGVSQAAYHWLYTKQANEAKELPPDPNDLLQKLSEQDTSRDLKASLELCAGAGQAEIRARLRYTADPEKRPTTTWPIPPFSADRVMFRTCTFECSGRVPVNEPFLLGGQMEPPHDGQAQTGFVWAAFGRVRLSVGAVKKMQLSKPVSLPALQLQTWTLAVPVAQFTPWIAQRHDAQGDHQALSEWLFKSIAGSGFELLATASTMLKNGARNRLNTSLEWNDCAGFELGDTATEYRVIPCESEEWSLQHQLDVEINRDESVANAVQPWSLNFSLSRPSKAARWLKWKSAMERDASDPNAVELAEVDGGYNHQGIGSESALGAVSIPSNRTTMLSACLKQDRVHVTFARLVGGPVIEPKQAPGSKVTTWIVDTPLSWQPRLLATGPEQMRTLAEELMQAVLSSRDVSLVGLLSSSLNDQPQQVSSGEPVLFMGGEFVNTRVAERGIFFNTRSAATAGIGDQMEVKTTQAGLVSIKLDSFGEPAWRLWGVWQPDVKATSAANSGVDQPVFPHCALHRECALERGVPQVLSVVRWAPPAGDKAEPPVLRWQIARLDSPSAPPKAAPSPAALPAWLGIVLNCADNESSPANDADVQYWFDEAISGQRPVLDVFSLNGSDSTTLTFGSEYHYTTELDENDVPEEKECTAW